MHAYIHGSSSADVCPRSFGGEHLHIYVHAYIHGSSSAEVCPRNLAENEAKARSPLGCDCSGAGTFPGASCAREREELAGDLLEKLLLGSCPLPVAPVCATFIGSGVLPGDARGKIFFQCHD